MKRNAIVRNFLLLAVFAFMVVISMSAQALAAPVFPFSVGYTASYSVTYPDDTSGTATLQITGTEYISGIKWVIGEFSNWDVSGENGSNDVRCTSDTLYIHYPKGSYPAFKKLPAGSSWSYTNQHGYHETATVVSIGPLTVAAGTFTNAYTVHYYALDKQGAINHDEDMYWAPGVGLVKDVDNAPGSPWSGGTKTMELITSPVRDILLGTWTGSMTRVLSTGVDTGVIQVTFVLAGDTPGAYTGTLNFTPPGDLPMSLDITAIKGPFDPNLVHVTSAGWVILGQLRLVKGANNSCWVLDLHGSDVSAGGTWASLGLIKQ